MNTNQIVENYLEPLTAKMSFIDAVELLKNNKVHKIQCDCMNSKHYVTLEKDILLYHATTYGDSIGGEIWEYAPSVNDITSQWYSLTKLISRVNNLHVDSHKIIRGEQTAILSFYPIGDVGDVLIIDNVVIRITNVAFFSNEPDNTKNEVLKYWYKCGYRDEWDMWYNGQIYHCPICKCRYHTCITDFEIVGVEK